MSSKYKTILVPVSFQASDKIAVQQAGYFAQLYQLQVVLLYVISVKSFFIPVSKMKKRQLEDDARAKLQLLAREAKDNLNLDVQIMVEFGSEYKTIAKVAELFFSKCIVLGFDKQIVEDEKLKITSNMLEGIGDKRCHIIAVTEGQLVNQIKTLVLPFDVSKETRQKISIAIDLAKLTNAKLKIVTSEGFLIEAHESVHLKKQMEQIDKFVAEYKLDYSIDFIPCEKNSKGQKDVVLTIANYFNQVQGDLLLMMANQERKQTVTQELIARTTIPSLSIISKRIGTISNFG